MTRLFFGLTLLASFAASAATMTSRFELRDASTSTSSCGSNSNCSASSNFGFGVGVTVPVWNFAAGWDVVTGAMLRQRILAQSYTGTGTATISYLDLDVPAMVQWSNDTFAIRGGVDVSLKTASTYSLPGGLSSNNYTDNGVVLPGDFALDWKFTQDQLFTVDFELGTTLATGNNGYANLSTSNVITLGYGYVF